MDTNTLSNELTIVNVDRQALRLEKACLLLQLHGLDAENDRLDAENTALRVFIEDNHKMLDATRRAQAVMPLLDIAVGRLGHRMRRAQMRLLGAALDAKGRVAETVTTVKALWASAGTRPGLGPSVN